MLKYAETHLTDLVHSAWDTLLADRPGVVLKVFTAGNAGVVSDIQSDHTDDVKCSSSHAASSDCGKEFGARDDRRVLQLVLFLSSLAVFLMAA